MYIGHHSLCQLDDETVTMEQGRSCQQASGYNQVNVFARKIIKISLKTACLTTSSGQSKKQSQHMVTQRACPAATRSGCITGLLGTRDRHVAFVAAEVDCEVDRMDRKSSNQ